MGIARVVIGLDGSKESAYALKSAIQMLPQEAEFLAVYGFDTLAATSASINAPFAATPPPPLDEWHQALSHDLEEDWCTPLREASRRYRSLVIEDAPASALIGAAHEFKADLIVVGHRHHGAFSEMVLGGTGHALVRHAHCPVLLIPAIS